MPDGLATQRAARRRSLWIALLCFALAALFFGGGGLVLVDQSLRGAFVPWEKVDPPAGRPPTALRLGDAGEVLLETAGGQLYEWSSYSAPPWEQVERPSGDAPYWSGDCRGGTNDSFVVAHPPGRVRQHVEATCAGSETAAYHYEFVLLDSGEIWSWSYSSLFGVIGVAAIYKGIIAVGGIGLGLLLGGLAYILSSISWRRGG